ncbi:SDR family NAD(P)-dependent oxidoreductase [uncultured Pseudonocardia sp.]|uniref:SDR family NAD(P)-dependent oxidoreductase n=1 Tax=uncultured Pseudonocardia sp. TaxID=211455 RepID=UPI0026181F7B|nr:SDR family NAD(P)-dependent oxidoreductase [uncultured Pseudonocardia sp.]
MAAAVRTALVTGANRGIGLAVARCLRDRGLQVVVAARDAAAAAAVAAELDGRWVAMDVTDPASVTAAAAAAGPVDVLVCNAGTLRDGGSDPLTVPMDDVAATVAVNLLGTWRVAQAFVPDMVARGWGRVAVVSSGTASFSGGLFAGTPGYTVSKTALNAVTVLLADATRGSGVLVNAVNPGRVRTRMMPGATTSPQQAAGAVADIALLPDDGPSGVFLRDGRIVGW